MERPSGVTLVLAVVVGVVACGVSRGSDTDARLRALWQRAEEQADAGQCEQVTNTGQEAVGIAPNSADAWALLAYACWLTDDEPRAEAAVDHALDLDQGSARAHYVKGLLIVDGPDAQAAVTEFREAARLEPELATAHAMLGSLLAEQGRVDEGIAELEEAVRLEPDRFESRLFLAQALGFASRLEEALKESDKALALAKTTPQEAAVRNNAAYLHAWSGQWNKALREASAAWPLCPSAPYLADTVGALTLLSTAQAGYPEVAEPALRQALRPAIDPGPGWTCSRAALAYCLALQNKASEARGELATISQGLISEHTEIDALYFAGKAYDALDEAVVAVRIFRRATERFPKHPWSKEMREYLAAHTEQSPPG